MYVGMKNVRKCGMYVSVTYFGCQRMVDLHGALLWLMSPLGLQY
jgi:hypothetical protein